MENYAAHNSINRNYGIQPIPAYIIIDKEGYVDRYLNADQQYKEMDVLEANLKYSFK